MDYPIEVMDKKRFFELWERCAVPGADTNTENIFNQLLEYYKETHRHYHTPQHVMHCLKQFDSARGKVANTDAVELAIWFHDVIYDPEVGDNEWRSTVWFSQCADGVLPPELIEQVVRLILITQHKNPPAKDDEKFVVDVDLSGFALPWDEFIQESDAVRKEFSHQSDKDYAQHQIPFLQSLLDRDSIYSMVFFRDQYEQAARENIKRKIKKLENILS